MFADRVGKRTCKGSIEIPLYHHQRHQFSQEAVVEKRTSERQLSVTDVTVIYKNLGLVKGKMLNFSLGGMCIDTAPICLPVNAAVALTFTVDTAAGTTDCEAHAIVVRTEDSNCCLMFDGMNQQTHQALRSLVGDWQILPDSSDMNQVAMF